ncbi:MAG: FkbM family methyltransferase [Nitrosomonadales bacterium]|nr:FkbM family methyltransferase [Nitrosomonadales bacterium]
MKQYLLNTIMGRAALSLRDKFEILHAALFDSDGVGTLANDQLAMKLVTAICQPGKVFIDVGAHIGSVISQVAHHDPSIRIVAIEAIPEKIAALRRKFPAIELHDCAVGESTGEVSFFINVKQSGYSSLKRPEDANKGIISEIRVPIRRLDTLVTSSDVDVIKIDVEGAELGALRGSENILNNCRPVIMFESGPQPDDDVDNGKSALFQFLTLNGYAIFVPNRVAHNDAGLSENGFIESHLYPRRTTNYFAIPKERRVEVRDRARSILNIHSV